MKILKFLNYLFLLLFLFSCTNLDYNKKIKFKSNQSNYSNYLTSKYSLALGDIEYASKKISQSEDLTKDIVLANLAFNTYLLNGEFYKAEKFKTNSPKKLAENYLYDLPTFILELKSKNYNDLTNFQIKKENFPGFKIIYEKISYISSLNDNEIDQIKFNKFSVFDLLIFENTKKEKDIFNKLQTKNMSEIEYFLYLGYLSRNQLGINNKNNKKILRTEHDKNLINDFFKKENVLSKKPDNNFIIANLFAFIGLQLSSQENVPAYYVKLVYEISNFLDSDSGFGNFYLSNLFEQEQNYDTALRKLEKVSEKSIMFLPAMLKKYKILRNQNERSSSVVFEEIKKRFNNNEKVNLIIANNYKRNNECIKAIAIYNKLIKKNVNNQNFLYFKGSCLEKLNKWKEAKKTFKELIKNNPKDAYSMNYLSYSMAIREEELTSAKKLILRAIELKKDNGFFIDTLGWIEFKLKNYNKALKHLQHAAKLEPNSSEILDHLGDIYLVLGREKEAIYEWKKALNGDGTNQLKKKIEIKINRSL